MADGEIEVDVGLATDDFGAGIDSLNQSLTKALTIALAIEEQFKNTATSVNPLLSQMARLNAELSAAKAAGNVGEVARIESLNRNVQESLAKAEAAITSARDEIRVSTTGRALAKEDILQRNRTQDGRTLSQAQLDNFGTQAFITGINTDPEQQKARLIEAAGRAAERLIKTTEDAMAASLNQTRTSTQIKASTFNDPTVVDALLNRSTINNEKLVRNYGGVSSLADVDAQKAKERADDQIRLDAEYEDRQRTLAANRIRRDAERENAERDRIARTAGLQVRADAQYEDRQRTLAAALQRRAAEAENRERDQVTRVASLQLRSEAEYEDRQRTLAANRIRREAERENAERDRIARTSGLQLRVDAQYEDSQRALASRIERRQAEEENRERDRIYRIQQAHLRADAEFDNQRFDREQKALRRSQEQAAVQENVEANRLRGQVASGFGVGGGYYIASAISQGVRSTIGAITEFDDKLKQFQAITQTADSETGQFRDTLLSLAAASRFSVSELTEAAITIGQTGLSAKDTLKALPAISNLATASGSTLGQATEVVTAVLGGYRIEAGRATEVSNVLAAALNQTRLTMSQLAQGISYSVDVAHDAGVSFVELTASIGSIAQAGVQSGSTMGTGVRQIIRELTEPSAKLSSVFKELGINLADIDVRSNGLVGVLENLRAKGFTTAEALRGFDLRTASTFSALSNQIDINKRMQASLSLSDSAAEGAAKANESLTASLTRMGNQAFSVLDKSLRPLVEVTKVAASAATGFFGVLDRGAPVLAIATTGLTALGVAAGGLKVFELLTTVAITPLARAFTEATKGAATFSGVMLALAANPLVLATGALVGAGLLIFLASAGSEADKAAERLDKLRGSMNDLTSRKLKIDTSTSNINDEIEHLLAQRDKLNNDPLLRQAAIIQAQKAFGDLGLAAKSGSDNIDELIESLRRLRGDLAKELPDNLTRQMNSLSDQIVQLKKLQEERDKSNRGFTVEGVEGGPGYTVNDSRFEQLGPQFAGALAATRNHALIDANDPRGSQAENLGLIQQAIREATARKDDFARRVDNGDTADGTAEAGLKTFQDRIELLTELFDRLNKSVSVQSNIRANEIAKEGVTTSRDASIIGSRKDVQEILKDAENLRSQEISRSLDVIRNPALEGNYTAQYEGVRNVVSDVNAQSKALEARVNALKEQLKKSGETVPALTQAFGRISYLIEQTNASMTREVSETLSDVKLGKGVELAARRTAEDAVKARLQRELSQSVDPDDIKNRIQPLIEHQIEVIRAIEEESYRLKAQDPTKPSAEIKASIAEGIRKAEGDKTQLADDVSNRTKVITKLVLQGQERLLKRTADAIQAEINRLEKELKDAATSTADTQNINARIKGLRAQLQDTLFAGIEIKTQRESIDAPKGYVSNSDALSSSATASKIVEAANAAGRNDLLQTLLRFAQLESAMGTNPGTRPEGSEGARGTFQFIRSTGATYGLNNVDGTNDERGDTGKATLAAIKYISTIDDNLRKGGFAVNDENRYLFYNQGEGAGAALLRNPGKNALQLYQEMGLSTPDKRITQNAGSTSDTAQEFVNKLVALFQSKTSSADKYVTAKSPVNETAEAERAKVREKTEADNAQTDREVAAAKRRKDQLELAVQDRELTATLAAQEAAVKRGLSAAQISETSSRVIDTIGQLERKAIEKDNLDKGDAGRDPRQKTLDQDAIREGYAAKAQQQALANADAVGKATLKVYQDQVKELEAKKTSYTKEENKDKVPQSEIDANEIALKNAQERLRVEGEYEATKARIAELEKQLREITDAGLGDASKMLEINLQIAEAKKKQAELQGQVNLQTKMGNSSASYANALSNGVVDFEKSRGIKNSMGELVSDTENARKALSGSLNAVANGFDGLFTALATKSKSAKDAFKDFAVGVLNNLAQMASKAVTNELMKMILSGGEGGSSILSSFGLSTGGAIPRFAAGGVPYKDGIPNRDSVPILAQPGEYMLRKSAVDAIGKDTLDDINAMGNRTITKPASTIDKPTKPEKKGPAAITNVYVMQPDQQPQLGPNDVIYAVSDNIKRSGSLKTLIKQVAAG